MPTTKTFAPVYPIPKRASKETPTYKIADAMQVTDPRVAARTDSPRVHQGSVDSPSAATVMNCTESSLNQSGTPITFPADTRSQSGNDSSQNTLRCGSNGAATKNGPQGIAQEPSNAEVKPSTEVRQSREMTDILCQAKSSNPKQSLTISMDSGASPSRDRVDVDTQSVEGHLTLKRKSSASEGEDRQKSSASEDVASRSDSQSLHSHERANKQRNGSERPHHTETKHNVKPGGDSNGADTTKNQSLQPPPPPLHRGTGRPRKISAEVIVPSSSSRTEKRGSHERKVAAPSKEEVNLLNALSIRRRMMMRPKTNLILGKGEDEVKADSESKLDTNLDYCEVCQGAGDLVCCDKCPRSFHLKCLRMTENDLPEGDWQCDECKKPSRFDAYSAAVAGEKTVLDKCLKIVQCLKSYPSSKQFLSPVENVPMYTKVVKQPMDLSKIENKLKKGAYIVDSKTVAEGVKELDTIHFANDVRLMWSNCKLFNDDGSGITRDADILSAGF
ncbi:hypothetical protein PsorP6_002042 [Peronosclerospora sorghi]|uniref:Uncharacterized protein n=1 Tax=Peronosclerospora sorghi TaxID=230839 RepID=A0ACC0WV26_9STRA|nr:hypothetical protein PsorP6_002042 [Peronosclerospora sorghi]